MRQILAEGIHGAVLIGALGAVTLIVGEPFVFPSIGPTAYVMVKAPDDPTHQPSTVIGGHVLGIVAGLIGYHLFATGLTVGFQHSLSSWAILQIMASGTFAMGMTGAGMLWTDIDHAPACATTLLVALGLLGTLQEALAILVAVVILVTIEEGVKRAPFTLPRRND